MYLKVEVEVELHHLQVVTIKDKAIIFYSIKNAIKELSDMDGVEPHGSVWVNSDHIDSVKRNGRITITDGTKIPVNRTKMNMLSR